MTYVVTFFPRCDGCCVPGTEGIALEDGRSSRRHCHRWMKVALRFAPFRRAAVSVDALVGVGVG